MRKYLTIAGTLFFLLAAQFLTLLMFGEAMAPGYVVHDNAISDLGVIPETAALFTLSLVLVGALNIIGGYYYFLVHRKLGLLAIYILAGIGAIGAGLVSLDSPLGVHGLFALLAFLFFNLEAVATARLVYGPMKAIAAVAGLIGLVFLIIMFLGDAGAADLFGPIGHGGAERMIAYPPMVWLMAMGGYLMAARARTEDQAT